MMSVLFTLVARAQKPFSETILELQDRAETVSELHLAVDYLARDFGGAERVLRLSETELLIQRESAVVHQLGLPANQADNGVRYSFEDSRLMRTDMQAGGSFVVATGLTGFDVGKLRKGELRIKLTDGVEPERHEIALVWRQR